MAAKKKVTKHKASKKDKTDILIEVSIDLHKKLVDSTEAMHALMKQQGELLNTFKEASKHMNDIDVKDENLRPLLKRLDDLLNQNRTIARGLVLLEKYVKERTQPPLQPSPPTQGPY